MGQHSTKGFYSLLKIHKSDDYSSISSLFNYPLLFEMLIFIFIGICLGVVLLYMWRGYLPAINTYLITLCTIGTLIIPQSSHDYTLSIITGSFAIFFIGLNDKLRELDIKWFVKLIIVIMSTCYFSLLYSYTNKPHFLLQNSFPILIVLLILIMISLFSCYRHPRNFYFRE